MDNKSWIRYGAIAILIIIFGLFVYPGMYQYDKYNQKIPVRINRITGTASMLTPTGWVPAESTAPTITEMDQFKKNMDDRFNALKQSIEKDMSDKLSAQVVASIKTDIEKAKKDIQDYKTAQLDPNNSFANGSTKDEVKRIMGAPTGTQKLYGGGGEVWSYDISTVTFNTNGVVTDYQNFSKNLKVK